MRIEYQKAGLILQFVHKSDLQIIPQILDIHGSHDWLQIFGKHALQTKTKPLKFIKLAKQPTY